eukprot:scaffold12360_cov109-Isochrysis_galbana.AAC.1
MSHTAREHSRARTARRRAAAKHRSTRLFWAERCNVDASVTRASETWLCWTERSTRAAHRTIAARNSASSNSLPPNRLARDASSAKASSRRRARCSRTRFGIRRARLWSGRPISSSSTPHSSWLEYGRGGRAAAAVRKGGHAGGALRVAVKGAVKGAVPALALAPPVPPLAPASRHSAATWPAPMATQSTSFPRREASSMPSRAAPSAVAACRGGAVSGTAGPPSPPQE